MTKEERKYAIECIEDIIEAWDGNSSVLDISDIEILKKVVEELEK